MFDLTVGEGIALASIIVPVGSGIVVAQFKKVISKGPCDLHHQLSADLTEVKREVTKTGKSVARIEGALGIKSDE